MFFLSFSSSLSPNSFLGVAALDPFSTSDLRKIESGKELEEARLEDGEGNRSDNRARRLGREVHLERWIPERIDRRRRSDEVEGEREREPV